MKTSKRRDFIKGAAVALGSVTVGAQAQPTPSSSSAPQDASSGGAFNEYSRFSPSFGGPPESDNYLGKLTPGLRRTGLAPVPVEAPDLGKASWRMVNGAKEFHLRCAPVKREFLPGHIMDVWGFNDSMPGPTIEAFQGDRVRIVVRNELPEPTSVHWHGLELPVAEDGVPFLTQDPIEPGKEHVYEFDLHQTGSFFYHSHFPMQEAFGMVGLFIIHPQAAFEPAVDRDFGLIFQNFSIPPDTTIPDSMAMDWNWHTINGRSAPLTTPLVVKHGERVRVRLLDFSPMQHHPIHLHGHTFWLTGTEAGRLPSSAWTPRNTTLVGVASVQDFEFIAFNPGDWIFHCHMVHHMMNHMVRQVGPRIRPQISADDYLAALPNRPAAVPAVKGGEKFAVRGYPQKMQGMEMSQATMERLNSRRETRGMRPMWHMGVKGLMTVLRVLPEDLYQLVMESDEPVQPGAVFEEIANRRHLERVHSG